VNVLVGIIKVILRNARCNSKDLITGILDDEHLPHSDTV